MRLSGFGKSPKPQKFDYIPQHYDEEKEDLKNRLHKYEGKGSDQDVLKSRIADGLRQRYVGDSAYKSTQSKKSNFRLLYIIIILAILSYLILGSDSIANFIKSIEG